ncbi:MULTISPECIES: hypothetical protein [Pyrobaculum]|uniref:Uncharacterized protein n=3 Tax=Pyrobaculum TaxID=2276 RepID=A4WJ26_PYRAR|nr:hypothetical protein [Pyrobaculum arsenaticum]ABP50393.1 conserved hypothetical protein [Pyrobaculum arsenaticum DSM 13514]AFA39552.1 hypothetical protein Pogu_1525 [Pyrobaculum oguniense TE7]MCY0890381.1 hypothetical protein [Pyrobaculum arsenaticum]NYR14663.1 hypothetical protein [Pyrobaculum arsenaticum]
MILIYSEKVLGVDIPQVVPLCDALDAKIIPLVGEDLDCLHRAVKKAVAGVALRTGKRLWVALARELRPDLTIYLWGPAPIRGKNIVPIRPASAYAGPGFYYVRDRDELRGLRGKEVLGLLLDARGFDPYTLELVIKGRATCGCDGCGLVERLLCEPYREVEVL